MFGAAMALGLAAPVTGHAQAGEGISMKSHWQVRAAHEFRAALKDGLGFSFACDGVAVGPEQAAGWTVEGAGTLETTFRHPSGLAVTRRARVFPEAEAVEYTLRFRNDGRTPSPVISEVNALDLAFEGDVVNGLSVVTCGGGRADSNFPPKDFALGRTTLGAAKDTVTLAADQGKSSAINMPFFFVEDGRKTAGVFAGIAWTGQWAASIRADGRTLRLRGGISNLRLRLEPGEEISSPAILVGAYRGSLADGANVLRRLVRDRYAPGLGGRRLTPPLVYTTWFDVGAELDEKLARTLIDDASAIGQEIFLVDAGWYKGTPKAPYTDMRVTWDAISNSLGNWEEGEERSRFPHGLKSLADYARSKGMQFGLWFEPERAGPDSLIARQHPDWMAFIPKRKWAHVNFGKSGVSEYFCKVLDRYIRELDLRYIRWDQNNHDLCAYWAVTDGPDRQGISQIRHLEGVHRVEEWVMKNHPGVILESCTGGGQRIDLATLARRQTIWVSDETGNPQIVRFHLEGLNHFVPGSAQVVAFRPPVAAVRKAGASFADIDFQCGFGGAFGSGGRLHEWPASLKEQARRHYDAYRKVRRFLDGDYYPLVEQPRTLDAWTGWQFHDPETGEGFVQAFRLNATGASRKFALRGLDAKRAYEFTDVYTGETFQAAGAALTTDGLEFALGPMTSRALTYRPAP